MQETTNDLFDHCQRWGLAGRVAAERARDALIARMPMIPTDQHAALIEPFLADQGLTSVSAAQAWISANHLTTEDLQTQAVRHALWLQCCEARFTAQLPSYFLKRKPQLDQVSYYALAVSEEPLSLELHQRLKERECTFDQLLKDFPADPEVGPRGRFGPLPLAELPEGLAELLRVSRPGQLWPPKPLQSGWLIVQLEHSKPAVLDQALRRRLLLELGEQLLVSPDTSNPTLSTEASIS
jgi:hypothetical protein